MNRINTELAGILKDRIRSQGPMTFRDFMAASLFHETHGFYTLAPAIGSSVGPFDTNAKFAAFGFAIAQAITMAAKVLGRSLRVLELGGGTGQLGACISSFLTIPYEYVVLEASPGLRAMQAEKGLKSVATLEGLTPQPTFVFGNEVLDAFPIHRVMGLGNDKVCELLVELDDDGEFCEQEGEVSTGQLLHRIEKEGIHLGRGQIAEICLDIFPFLQGLERVIRPGYIIFVDYGDKASNIYSYRHRNGTLRSYYQQQRIHDPFFAVGQQDLTADVDFTAVIHEAETVGLESASWISQSTWLTNLGIQKYVETGDESASRQQEVDLLIGESRLGSTFDVLMFKTQGLSDGPGFKN